MDNQKLTNFLVSVGDTIVSNDGNLLKTAEGRTYKKVGAGMRFDQETGAWVQAKVWVKCS